MPRKKGRNKNSRKMSDLVLNGVIQAGKDVSISVKQNLEL
jgi:hypothetical protein